MNSLYSIIIPTYNSEATLSIAFDESVLDTIKNEKYKGKYGDPYQNSEKGYEESKVKTNKMDLLMKFEDFFIGYQYFLGTSFLKEYGNYTGTVFKPKQTMAFNYFIFLDFKRTIKTGLKGDVVWLFKKIYYRFHKKIKLL